MPYSVVVSKFLQKALICMAVLLLLQPTYAQEVNLGGPVSSSPVFADVDDDLGNGLEIIVGTSKGYIYAIYSNGSLMNFSSPPWTPSTGWSLYWDTTARLAGYSSAAVADIAGDSEKEILIGGQAGSTMSSENEGFLWAFNLSAQILRPFETVPRPNDKEFWTYSTGKSSAFSSPSVGDIDGDGDNEVLVGNLANRIFAFEGDGALKWSKLLGGKRVSTPALGDLDGSGTSDIVVGSSDGKIYVLKGDGTELILPIQTGGLYYNSPALADIDNDGGLEIISASIDGKIYAWHGNGTIVNGWPVISGPVSSVTSPTVGDLDADGDLEVVIVTAENDLYAFHGDGTPMAGFPISHPEKLGFTSPSLSDLDGDGNLEIILGASKHDAHMDYGMVYAWHINLTSVSGFPKSMDGWIKSSPGVSDIDFDGKNELVIVEDNGKVSIWEMGNKSWNLGWPTFHYNERNTRMYDAPTVAISSPSDGTTFRNPVPFIALANDVDGSIVSYEWISDLDGLLGSSSNFEKALSNGNHIITLTVIDLDGKVAKTKTKITVADNLPPTASINSPAEGSIFTKESSISFSGSGVDLDGSIVAYSWASDKDGNLSNNSSFSISSLSLGWHTIGLTVSDNQGAQGSAQINILIDDPPTASINSPLSGSVFNPGDSISFNGIGNDSDGTIISFSWESSLNGLISSETTFETSSLSIGNHAITFTVTDNNNATGSTNITVRVNSPPTAAINSPSNSSVFNPWTNINFSGIATDMDGEILNYAWTSNLDGGLSLNASFTNSNLTIGTHTINFEVTDHDGALTSSQIEIRINDPPTAKINLPVQDSLYNYGDLVVFNASIKDTDGTLLVNEWISDKDGVLSSSDYFSTTRLTLGVHIITLIVTDNDGASDSVQVKITINDPPKASIALPNNESIFISGETVSFKENANDSDGTIVKYSWESNQDGPLSQDPNFETNSLSLGNHLITLTVTDNDGASDSSLIYIKINDPPIANILSPADGDVYFQRNTTTFDGEGSDTDGNIVSYLWTSSIDGLLNSSASFSSSDLSVGLHSISLTVTDNDGGVATDQVTINQTGYSLIWRNPSPGEEFKAGRTIPIKFAVYEDGQFVVDETVVVRIFDSGGTEVFKSTYTGEGSSPGASAVQIDAAGEQYSTNYHIPKDAMGTYTIKVEFESNRPNTEYSTSYEVPASFSGVLKKIQNAIRRGFRR